MPKSRKRRQKPTNRQNPRTTRSAVRSSPLTPIIGDFSFSRGFGIGRARDEDWDRLREEFLRDYPVCPDCAAPWDLDFAGEEEGTNFDGEAGITLSVMCSAYEDDVDAGREPRPHGRTDDGMIQYAITLA